MVDNSVVGESSLLSRLRKIIGREDPVALQLHWSLFCCAVRSFRRESLLKPFPPMFRNGDEKDFTALEAALKAFPPLSTALPHPERLSSLEMELALFIWEEKEFRLKRALEKDAFVKLQKRTGAHLKVQEPDFIFEVVRPQYLERRFREEQGEEELLYAYHGSQLAHFYSILHHGLVSNMNKTSLFGEGTYLSSELGVSLNWSPLAVPGFAPVPLGQRLSCVAFCEVVNRPDGVKFGTDSRSLSSGGDGGRRSVPEKYVVVRNDSLLRVKYLLLYAEKQASPRQRRSLGVRTRDWLFRQRWWLLAFAYCLLLAAVGVLNSRDLQFYLRRFSHYWNSYHSPHYDER